MKSKACDHMTNNQSESLSLEKNKRKDLKKNLPQKTEGNELVVEPEDERKPIDYSPHVRVGNLLVFEEMTAVEVIIPIPVAYLGMLESASAREWWGKDQFGDSPIWKNGLSWLYDEFLSRLDVISDFFVPCDYWNVQLGEEERKKAQTEIRKQILLAVEKLTQNLMEEESVTCGKPETILRRRSTC